MVTTSAVPVDAPWMLRIISRSIARPRTGAATSSTSTSASHAGQPHPCQSCQKKKARTMPTAPWAKLKTPVVL